MQPSLNNVYSVITLSMPPSSSKYSKVKKVNPSSLTKNPLKNLVNNNQLFTKSSKNNSNKNAYSMSNYSKTTPSFTTTRITMKSFSPTSPSKKPHNLSHTISKPPSTSANGPPHQPSTNPPPNSTGRSK
jgi:hypothetical protein